MDREEPSGNTVAPGISIRHGAVDEMDIDKPATNGTITGKRKGRESLSNGKNYKESSSENDEDARPLVFHSPPPSQNSIQDR